MMAVAARPTRLCELAGLLGLAAPAGRAGATPIVGLSDDSRAVAPGEVFFARRGTEQDGSAFARDAARRGAAVVVAATDLSRELDVPCLCVPDVDEALCKAADAWFGRPQDAVDLIGITGTKGKTTTATLTVAGLRACGRKAALFGTIVHDPGDGRPEPSGNTTPGLLALRRLLARARDAGCDAAVMEVSSHALDQARVRGLEFRAAVFTNPASDHLDYHRTPEAYFEAKARLFRSLPSTSMGVLNREDPAWPELAALCSGAVLTYGTGPEVDLRADAIELTANATRFRLRVAGDGERDVKSALVGGHNVLNILASLGACVGLGLDPIVAAEGAAAVDAIPGRLQRVARTSDLHVFVDYAHTEDALRQVLQFLRQVGAAPLTCVIGCGGDRDRSKRPLMARAAAELAERVVFTSDNPRSEDPSAILDGMTAGLTTEQRGRTDRIPDRRAAIRHAIAHAPAGSTVLVAGKGHETYQILGSERVPFDDVAEVRLALADRAERSQEGKSASGESPA